MSKILVTGASGFVGQHLIKACACEHGIAELFKHNSTVSDITRADSLDSYLNKNIDVVVHLAGKTFVPASWQQPTEFFNVNQNGTLNVLEFCRKENARIIYVSSYLYGNASLPTSELDPIQVNNPYSLSKYLAEELVRNYARLFNVKASIVRPFNLYGKGQSSRFLIPELIQKVNSKQEYIEIIDDSPKRDFLHVNDFVSFLIQLIQSDKNDVYNVGSGISYSPRDICETLFEISKKRKPIAVNGKKRPNEIAETRADIFKAKHELGWKPVISLHSGLAKLMLHG